ncbi:MAG: phosphoserine phosphatase SerB [Alphaproteobacteria bacterium]|nr:phosphoserine phosphatase SerB [Alphaproteobacteria bacterium]
MDDILTLIVADAAKDALNPWVLANLDATLAHQGIVMGKVVWLSAGRACDIPLTADYSLTDIEERVRTFFDDAPIDLMVSALHGRRKRLLVADMDQTIITRETLDEMAAHAGLQDEIAAITARTMRGELAFEDALRERLIMLKGLPEDALQRTLAAVEPSPGAKALVATMNRHGAYTALVSGGFTYFTEPVKKICGFQFAAGNVLIMEDGKLAGTVTEPILGRDAKVDILNRLADEHGITTDDALTIGDGANDLGMIEAAGLGIAYYGKPLLATAARARIEYTDLRTALYFQGYSDAEIKED